MEGEWRWLRTEEWREKEGWRGKGDRGGSKMEGKGDKGMEEGGRMEG